MYKKIITVISSLFIVISPVIVNSQTAGSNVKWLLEPVYERVTSFSEGLAFAIKKDNYSGFGSYVYIDKKGKEIVKGEFIDGDAFSEGVAKIHLITSNKKYSYIDKDGKKLLSVRAAYRRHQICCSK